MTINNQLFNQVSEFLSIEADMLDHREYQDWLKLWQPDGLYIVPVDVNADDYKNALNVAYDNEHMRQLRVDCSYMLYENKAGDLRPYPAKAEFVLVPNGSSFLLKKKLVKLMRSSQYLATISYIF